MNFTVRNNDGNDVVPVVGDRVEIEIKHICDAIVSGKLIGVVGYIEKDTQSVFIFHNQEGFMGFCPHEDDASPAEMGMKYSYVISFENNLTWKINPGKIKFKRVIKCTNHEKTINNKR